MARQRDEQKREKILESSVKLFSLKGFHATSIQDIVSETGLSVGTIYLYFQNKEEIFDALIENGLERFTEELFRDITVDMEVEEVAERFVSTIMETLSENIQLVSVLTNELSFQKKLQSFYSRIAEAISTRYMGDEDVEKFYSSLNMSRKEFYSLVTILVSGLSNALRLASGSRGQVMKIDDIRFVVKDVFLSSILNRIEK